MSNHMILRRSVMVAVATSMLGAGYAFAADQALNGGTPTSTQEKAADKDAGKLSVDGAKGFQDVALARMAIFDGNTADAKKYVDAANAAFGKAKGDRAVFVKAENAMMPSDNQAKDASNQGNPGTAPNGSSQNADAAAPKAWLPVDGEIAMNEDFSADPAKAAAVNDANKSLANGDRQGAMRTLKLAQVDLDYVVAVVPLEQTINDVHQAATLVDGGKFYQASQQLRQVQDSARYDAVTIVGTPEGANGKAPASGGPASGTPMKGAPAPAANK